MLSHYQEEPSSGNPGVLRVVRLSDVLDGTTNTLMLGEISRQMPSNYCSAGNHHYRMWIRGNSGGSGATKNVRYPINSTYYNCSNNFNEISFMSNHPGGAQFALGDASVRFIPQTIDLIVYQMSSSMNGSENVTLNP
jgi:hypothetical protein